MKNHLFIGALLSVIITPAMADMPAHGFIGLTVGGMSAMYGDTNDTEFSDDAYSEFTGYLPGFHIKVGAELGARFGTLDDIWNIGATAFYDYGMSADADGRGADLLLVDSISVGYTMFGATLDNYVRVYSDKGSSLFLVGGVGYANVGQSVEITNAGQTDSQSESEGAIVAKIGGIYNFDTNWGMTFGVRAAMPENLTLVNYEIGLRYTF